LADLGGKKNLQRTEKKMGRIIPRLRERDESIAQHLRTGIRQEKMWWKKKKTQRGPGDKVTRAKKKAIWPNIGARERGLMGYLLPEKRRKELLLLGIWDE